MCSLPSGGPSPSFTVCGCNGVANQSPAPPRANHQTPATDRCLMQVQIFDWSSSEFFLETVHYATGKEPSFYIRKIRKATQLWPQSCQWPCSLTHEDSKKTTTERWNKEAGNKTTEKGRRKNRNERKEAEKEAEECSERGAGGGGWLEKQWQSDTGCGLSLWIQQTLTSNVSLPLCS